MRIFSKENNLNAHKILASMKIEVFLMPNDIKYFV